MKSNKNVLVITPFSDYGDLICQSIGKIISGNVKSVSTIHAVAKYSGGFLDTDSSIDFVLMDLEAGVEKARECISIVRNSNPSVKIIIISKNDPPEEIEALRPWNLLTKPFVEKDLLEIIKSTINQKKVNVIDGKFLNSENPQLPLWARDKGILTNIMQDTLEHLDAQQAILLTKEEIIASAGSLPDKETKSCSMILNKYMDFSGHGELIKQVRLEDNSYLMHALVLTVGLIIALLFDPDTSYELIRGQTRHLAGKITKPALPGEFSSSSKKPELLKTKTGPSNRLSSAGSIQVDLAPNRKDYVQPGIGLIQDDLVEVEKQPLKLDFEVLDSVNIRANSKNSNISEKVIIDNKRPSIISVGMSQLPFTCLLIPRLDPRSISNDVVEFLEERTPMIFLSYGWKLNDIMVKNNMMQWIAAIPPIIAPAFQIKTIRKETSKLIFENFPKLSMDGLMKDFWIPGYLVAIGSERISEKERDEMIENNQQRYYLDDPTNISGCAKKVLYND